MVATIKFTRAVFGAAVALYVVWIGALVALAVVSGDRPGHGRTRLAPAPAPAAVPLLPDQEKE